MTQADLSQIKPPCVLLGSFPTYPWHGANTEQAPNSDSLASDTPPWQIAHDGWNMEILQNNGNYVWFVTALPGVGWMLPEASHSQDAH